MTWTSFIRDHKVPVALVASLGSERLDEVILKIAFTERVTARLSPGATIPWITVANILEDEELGLSDTEAIETLVRAGLALKQHGELTVPERINPQMRLEDGLPPATIEVSRDEFLRALTPGRSDEAPTVELTECVAALDRTSLWGATLATLLPSDLPGVPVFWSYDDAGNYSPFNLDPASLTTSDTLRLVVERTRFGLPLPRLMPAQRDACVLLLEKLLRLQRSRDVWVRGSLRYAGLG